MHTLSYDKIAIRIASTGRSRAGAELDPPNPTKMHFFFLFYSSQVIRTAARCVFHTVFGISWWTQDTTLHSLYLSTLSCCSVCSAASLSDGINYVCKASGIWLRLVSQEAAAEIKLKCLSIQLCFSN